MRRRGVLAWLGGLGGVAIVGRARLAAPGRIGAAPLAAPTIASTWIDTAPATTADDGGRAVVSAAHRAPAPFMAIGIDWPAPLAGLAIRTRADAGPWSAWRPVSDHESHVGPDGKVFRSGFHGLQVVPPSVVVQYRYQLAPGQAPVALRLTLIDSTTGPAAPRTGALSAASAGPPVIARAGWGADEGLRFDASGKQIWPPEYRVTQKGIVHHTVTDTGGNDPAAVVRAIYYYHAVTLGWGDIGYNFLVDWLGNVYEGRYGGPNVVGGHAAQYNYGSVGVACIGDFSSATPGAAMERALARTLAWKCQYLDPHGQAYFIDDVYANISGHRDFNAGLPSFYKTDCPGDALYAYLPGLRGDVSWDLDGLVPTPAGRVTGVSIQPTSLVADPGQPFDPTLQVSITIANVGTGTMVTQPPAPGLIYAETDTFVARGYPAIAGTWRVGLRLDPPGAAGGVDFPYRWGLPDALEPGQSTTIAGQVQLTAPTSRLATAALIQELVGQTAFGCPIPITVAAPGSPSPAPGLPYRVYLPGVSDDACPSGP